MKFSATVNTGLPSRRPAFCVVFAHRAAGFRTPVIAGWRNAFGRLHAPSRTTGLLTCLQEILA
jgi:hypothetical protein